MQWNLTSPSLNPFTSDAERSVNALSLSKTLSSIFPYTRIHYRQRVLSIARSCFDSYYNNGYCHGLFPWLTMRHTTRIPSGSFKWHKSYRELVYSLTLAVKQREGKNSAIATDFLGSFPQARELCIGYHFRCIPSSGRVAAAASTKTRRTKFRISPQHNRGNIICWSESTFAAPPQSMVPPPLGLRRQPSANELQSTLVLSLGTPAGHNGIDNANKQRQLEMQLQIGVHSCKKLYR